MGRKIENRNIDVTKARGELEEDLLEYVYRTWRQGRQITSKEYAREVNITGYEAAGLVRSLVKKGFLCEPENGHLELSDKGKLEGMECLARHEKWYLGSIRRWSLLSDNPHESDGLHQWT